MENSDIHSDRPSDKYMNGYVLISIPHMETHILEDVYCCSLSLYFLICSYSILISFWAVQEFSWVKPKYLHQEYVLLCYKNGS